MTRTIGEIKQVALKSKSKSPHKRKVNSKREWLELSGFSTSIFCRMFDALIFFAQLLIPGQQHRKKW